jgi:hypothetical protein
VTEQNGIVELNDSELDFVSGGEFTLDEVFEAIGGFFSWLGRTIRDIRD